MKILVICQYYFPEPFRISDICEALVQRGHEVTVVTGTPNYPMGEIYDGYQNDAKSDEKVNGVKVHRCSIIPRKTGMLHRFLNYFSYPFESSKYVRNLDADFDVVFVNQLSPVMMAKAGIKYKKKNNKKLILYCLDLWPESLVAGGIKRGSAIYKFFHKMSERIYVQADKILVTSKSFVDYFAEEFDIREIEYLPQYAEDLFSPDACYKEPNATLDLMFAGNLGTAQSVETIIEAARVTQDQNIHWHIVGDGSEYQRLRKLAENLANVTFYGRQPLDKMPEFYSKADAMIVTMGNDNILSLTLPGKVQTYMAAGKPIIAAINGETKTIVEEAQCGFVCAAEDGNSLARLATSFTPQVTLGQNAYQYYIKNFSRQRFIDALESQLETVV